RCELRGVDALLAVEPQGARDAAGALEAGGVLVAGVGTVHAAQAVGARGRDDRLHRRMPAVAGIDLVVRVELADAGRGHPHRGGEIAGPEDQRLQPRRGARDLARVEKAAGVLDLRLYPDRP